MRPPLGLTQSYLLSTEVAPLHYCREARVLRFCLSFFTALLEKYPDDEESRWLLNVAYMQLGQYSAKVPARYLAPPSLYASEYDLGECDDIALTTGVDLTSHAGGAIVEDFDGDGLLDIMVTSSMPGDQIHLFHNNGDTYQHPLSQSRPREPLHCRVT